MSASTTRSLAASVFLHVTAALLLCIGFTATRRPIAMPAAAVFTLVTSGEPVAAPGPAPAGTPSIRFTAPEPAHRALRPADPRASSDRAPRTLARVVPPSTISYREFCEQHPTSSLPAQRGSSAVPRVSATFTFTRQGTPGSIADRSSELSFVAALLSDLQSAFDGAGVAFAGLQATVEFTLGRDGALLGAAIARSSGSRDFDAAVLAAMSRARAKGFADAAAGQRYALTFRAAPDR